MCYVKLLRLGIIIMQPIFIIIIMQYHLSDC